MSSNSKIIVKKVDEPRLETTNLLFAPLMNKIFELPGYRYFHGTYPDAWKAVREKDSKVLAPFRDMMMGDDKTKGYIIRNDGTIFRSPPLGNKIAAIAQEDPYTISVLDYLLDNKKYLSHNAESITGYPLYNSLVRLVHDILTDTDRHSIRQHFAVQTREARENIRHERFEPHQSMIGGVNRYLKTFYSEPWELEEIKISF